MGFVIPTREMDSIIKSSGIALKLMDKNKIAVEILATDDGLYDQEVLARHPSPNHKTRVDNTWKRMPPMHITLLTDIFNNSDLQSISNSYILPLTLIAIEIKNFSSTSILKIITLTLVNIVIVNIVCHLILRRAMINKIYPDAENKDAK
jgi:multisubunit Na+/H+ antiporter MnhG subunit